MFWHCYKANNTNQGLKINLDYQQIINQRLVTFELKKA